MLNYQMSKDMKKLLMMVCLTVMALSASAEDLTLTVPELEPKLTYGETMTYRPELSLHVTTTDVMAAPKAWSPDFDFFKSKTNPGVKPYKFMDEMTFVGVPLFVAGLAIKGDKAMFRVNNKDGKKNTQLLTDFKTGIDDYTQYFGPALTVGLKLGGYEGRSDWPRLLASAGMSYGIMAALVNGIKYTAKEMRPDGSQANSWPSGHTATSFVGATLLHKEYGLTRSPWFSVAGYGVATATGVMRVLNNRHWVSDVMSGAGIGIISTELGYALCDLMFKGKGLLRNDLETDSGNPSFFGINMGVGIGGKSIEFSEGDLVNIDDYKAAGFSFDSNENESLEFRASTVVDAEGAYFFNKYVGIGGRFRVRAMSAKSFGQYADISTEDPAYMWLGVVADPYVKAGQVDELFAMTGEPLRSMEGVVKSDHLAEFTGSVGFYFNIPVTKRLAIGTKFLVGRSLTQELDIDAHAEGDIMDINYDMTVRNGALTDMNLSTPTTTGQQFDHTWDYLTIGANSSTSYGTGISLTYRYKSNFSWKIFCDYDYTKKTYTLKVDPLNFMQEGLTKQALSLVSNPLASDYSLLLNSMEYKKDKKMNYFTLGLSFLVNL